MVLILVRMYSGLAAITSRRKNFPQRFFWLSFEQLRLVAAATLVLRCIAHVAKWTKRGFFKGAFAVRRLQESCRSTDTVRGAMKAALAPLAYMHLPNQ